MTENEKVHLIFKTCRALTQMESRGELLSGHEPKPSIVIEEYDDYLTTEVKLTFPDKRVADACNWGGMAKTLPEALTSNLQCLSYELEERIKLLQNTLVEVKAVAFEEKEHEQEGVR